MSIERVNKQDNSQTVSYQSTGNEKAQGKKDDVSNKKQDKSSNTIYAGDLELGQNDILAKKDQMKKNAIKVLLDAFSGELEIDEKIDNHRRNIEEFKKEADTASDEIGSIRELKQNLQDTFAVDDDSIEQKDLELLEKKKNYDKGLSNIPLTKEEQEQIKNMGPLTEYQQAALEYHDMEIVWRKRLNNSNAYITYENRSIEGIKLARVKTHNMVDAGKDSQKILDAAGKEVVSGLLGEAKDKVDDKLEEDAKKTEELKDKQKEKEELEAKASSKKEAEQKLREARNDNTPMEQVQKGDVDWDKFQREIKVMMEKAKILLEDMKGLTVDEQV